MADELNTPTHRWYEPRNNTRLANTDFSKQWIYDSGVQKIDQAIATRLFSVPGSRGFFYDFSDYSTMFGDTAGTTPVTGVGQSVGLVLDESRGLALGPELVTNGTFDSGTTGWTANAGSTISIVGGRLRVSRTSLSTVDSLAFATVVGRTYEIRAEISNGIGRITAGAGDVLLASGKAFFTAVGATTVVALRAAADGTSCDFDNISVRELPGNHATQATAGNRALTQVRPMFTQRNRAVGSELPENAVYWATSSTINGVTMTKVASGIDTDGLPYADYAVAGTATGVSILQPYSGAFSRTPASPGQTWSTTFIARRIAGAAPPALCGVRISSFGETAPSTTTETISTAIIEPPLTDTVVGGNITLANGATNQASAQVDIRTASGATVNYTVRIKAFQFELGSTRTTYQPAVSGELRNLMFTSGNPLLWTGTGTTNGITITRIATGVDAAGLPYADYSVSGTATTADFRLMVGGPSTRPATVGQTFTSSVYVERLAGTAPPAGSGVYTEVVELGAGGTFLAGTASLPQDAPTPEAFRTATRTLSNASLVDVRGGVIITTASGATVNYTVRIKAPQFEQASTYSRYQRTITANEWYEPGFTSYRGLRFDGSDDFLQTAAIDFSNSDKMTVVAGVRKLSDAGNGTVVEFTAAAEASNGTIFIRAPSGGLPNYQFWSRGTADSFPAASGFASPISNVLTCLGDISGDSAIIRANGAQVVQSSADQGTGTYGNHPVFIGRRGGTTLPFNGVLTFLCVINRTLTADDLALLETIANSRTGAY